MRNKIFSILLVILFLTGFGVFFVHQKDFSRVEKRVLKKNSDLNIVENNIEDILKDQFYCRDLIMKGYYKIKLAFNELPYIALNSFGDSNLEYKYLGKNVIEINNEFLINDILTYDKEKIDLCKSRAFNINEVDLKYPDIKTYVYFPTKLEETIDFKDNYGTVYREKFIKQLNPNISYSELEIDCLDEYLEYFYKTDFHWTGKGAYEAYKNIIEMINKDFDIGLPKEIKNINIYNNTWTGNVASEIGGNWVPDNIVDIEINDVDNFKYYVNGQKYDYGKEKNSYKINGNDTMYSDYDFFYGNNYFERRFELNDETKPNMLVFCDSLSNVNLKWIASHFNTTVYIDLRANDGSFNLDDYINKYNIDIIMVNQIYSNLYFNGYMFIPLS